MLARKTVLQLARGGTLFAVPPVVVSVSPKQLGVPEPMQGMSTPQLLEWLRDKEEQGAISAELADELAGLLNSGNVEVAWAAMERIVELAKAAPLPDEYKSATTRPRIVAAIYRLRNEGKHDLAERILTALVDSDSGAERLCHAEGVKL